MNPIHQFFQKISNGNHFSKLKKGNNSNINWGFYPKSNDLYFMIIYLCIKYELNTLIVSKDIERKPFFSIEKGAITPIIIGDFILNRT